MAPASADARDKGQYVEPMIERPTHKSAGGVHLLDFSDIGIEVQVDRMYESSRGETTGELLITGKRPEFTGHVHQTRLNMTSSRSKVMLANDLNKRYGWLADDVWRDAMEYVCVMVLRSHREGLPAIHMADYTASEALSFRLNPFIQERNHTILFGHGDTGKSWLAMAWGYMVAAGQVYWLDMECEPGRVLYLDYETDEDTFWHRLDMISAGMRTAIPDGFWYRRMRQKLASDYQELSKLVLREKIDLIIVDSGAPAVVTPEDAASAIEYSNALSAMNVASVTVAHLTKSAPKDEVYPFGSGFWRNLSRWNFRVHVEKEPGASEFTMGLVNTKANNGPMLKQKAYRLAFTEGQVEFHLASPFDVGEVEESMPLSRRIEFALRQGAMTLKELEEAIPDAMGKSISAELSKHRDKRFIQVERGLWGLLKRETY